MAVKAFLSWSGSLSRELGESLYGWLPMILQNVEPYFTPTDIDKGQRWSAEISLQLEEADVGIFCITKDNMRSEWLMFEAGAISKKLNKSRVCPILFDIEPEDVTGPLGQFQMTRFDQTEIRQLVRSLNRLCDGQSVRETVLDQLFPALWPELQKNVEGILAHHVARRSVDVLNERAMLEEILKLGRLTIAARLTPQRLEDAASGRVASQLDKLERALFDFLESFRYFFHDDWPTTREEIKNGHWDGYRRHTFLRSKLKDDSKWSARDWLLRSYQGLMKVVGETGFASMPPTSEASLAEEFHSEHPRSADGAQPPADAGFPAASVGGIGTPRQ